MGFYQTRVEKYASTEGLGFILTRKLFFPVISNYFGKNTVNRIHFELILGKNLAYKHVQKSCKINK